MPNNADLGSIVRNETARRVLYGIYIVAGLFFGSAVAWYGAVGEVTPDFVTGGLQVLGYLAIPFGTLALANVNNADKVVVDFVDEI